MGAVSGAISDVGSAVGDFGSAIDPTTTEGLTNIATGGISAIPGALGGLPSNEILAQYDPSTSEGLTNLGTALSTGGMSGIPGAFGGPTADQFFSGVDDKLIQPALEGVQGFFEDAFGSGALGSGVNTDLINQRYQDIAAPGIATGQQAQQLQADFSGASGPEAQAAAYQGFQDSPGTAFLRERGMRGINSGSAVTGRGGGGLMAELSRFNQGLALQDLDRQQQQLNQLAQQGLQAGGLGTSLTGIESGAITSAQNAAADQQAGLQDLIGQVIGLGAEAFIKPGASVNNGKVSTTGGIRPPSAEELALSDGFRAGGLPAPGAPPSPMAAGTQPTQGLVPGQTPIGQGMATQAIAPQAPTPQGISPQGAGPFAGVLNQAQAQQGISPQPIDPRQRLY